MDAELREKIADLVALCERRREEVLSDLVGSVVNSDLAHPQGHDFDRVQVATLALSYAEWTQALEGYRRLLQGEAERPRLRLQR